MPPTYTPYPTYTALPTYTPPPTQKPQSTRFNWMSFIITSTMEHRQTIMAERTQTSAAHKTQTAYQPQTITPSKIPYSSPTAKLKLEITVKVYNYCDYTMHLKMVGPMTVELIAKPGEIAEQQLPRGTYTLMDSNGNQWEQTLDVYVWYIEYCQQS